RARGREARGAARGRRREGARRGSPAHPGRPRSGPPRGPQRALDGKCAVARTPSHDQLTLERRARLLAGIRALVGASVQKVWLPSAAVAVLQVRAPRRTALVVADARLAFAAVAPERPTSTERAPKSQATLRAALEGARP